MLTDLSVMASEQTLPTENSIVKTHKFMEYAAPDPVVILTYPKSDMVLAVYSDASHLSEPKACSHTCEHCFSASDVPIPVNNEELLNTAQINKIVMSSEEEGEMGAIFLDTREAIPEQNAIIKMCHPQRKKPIQTDNSTAYSCSSTG